jgi:putative methionine-R-sulfoxide reductase with GAF domain
MAKFNLSSSLKTKLAIRFGALTAVFIVCVVITLYTLSKIIYINREINTVYTPSVQNVNDLKVLIINSKSLISTWVYVQAEDNTTDKTKLRSLIGTDYVAAQKTLKSISANWTDKDKMLLDSTFKQIQLLFEDYQKVMQLLNSFESYNDPTILYAEIYPVMQEQGSITLHFNAVRNNLDRLVQIQTDNAHNANMELTSVLAKFKVFISLIAFFTLVLGVIITISTIRSITRPILEVKEVLSKMGKGVLENEKLAVSNNEIGEMSAALNFLSDSLKETAAYADKIGNGEFSAAFTPLSEEDILGNSLLGMGQKLKTLSEEERKRNWVTSGLASFADILRSESDVAMLSDTIISNLVKYLGANQGGIFLVNDLHGEVVLNLVACYAYERKKYIEKTIHEGEGLVGQCLLEKDTIYLTEVPDNYVKITSGLGSANPNCVVVQPLTINDELVGVVEIASFKVLDKFEMEFLAKLSENIASVISSVKVNERTVKLLEEAKMSHEALKAQEEELRQNLEELTATQEEIQRKEQEYIERIKELESQLNVTSQS